MLSQPDKVVPSSASKIPNTIRLLLNEAELLYVINVSDSFLNGITLRARHFKPIGSSQFSAINLEFL